MKPRASLAAAAVLLNLLLGLHPAIADMMPPSPSVIAGVAIDQNTGVSLPRDVPLIDDAGRRVLFGEYLGTRPAVLIFVSYKCQMLCPMLLNHLTLAMNGISLRPGRDFDVLAVGLDPRETSTDAAERKQACLRQYGHGITNAVADPNGWHFFTGTSDAIQRLETTVGFHAVYDAPSGLYAHPAGAMFVSPSGTITRYLYGIDFAPSELRQALDDAAAGQITRDPAPQQVYCAAYDPGRTRIGRIITLIMRTTATATLLVLGTYILLVTRRDRTAQLPPDSLSTSGGHP